VQAAYENIPGNSLYPRVESQEEVTVAPGPRLAHDH
jgi:hypothetical protein